MCTVIFASTRASLSICGKLASITSIHEQQKCDFPLMCQKIVAQCYLYLDLDDLSALPHDDFGKKAFEFNLAEVRFL